MTQVTEAIYSNGMLQPIEPLSLREQQRVRLVVESLDAPVSERKKAALRRLRDRIARMKFRSTGRYPTRDELHERR